MAAIRNLGIGILLILFTFPLNAQTTGEIRGIVTDPSGSVVPGAKVTLNSTETGDTRSVSTDNEGRYAFPLLKIGEYNVSVEAPGFRKMVGATVVRSAEITSANLKLEVGPVSEQVVVTDVASILDTQSAQVQESVQSKVVQELPVGRNPNLIASTLPGIVPALGPFNSGSFNTNGNRARSNNITIDNITATDVVTAGTGSTNNGPLNFSSIKEIKIITNSFSAEFGRNSGAQVQYITKSGTNDFHGELYEYLQNDMFNARDWFDRSGAPTFTRFNQFGGVFGGPIIENKTHFFVSAEMQKNRGLGAARLAKVPTASMLAAVTDATSRAILDQYKLPAATTDEGSFGSVQQNAATALNFHQWSARVDHRFSENDTLYARYGIASNESGSSGNTFIDTNIAGFGLKSVNKIYSVNLNETHVFSPNVVNEFRAGFGRTSPIFEFDTTTTPGPRIIITSQEVDRFGHWEGAPQGRVQNTYQIGDSLTWINGAHNIRMGGDFYRYQSNSYVDNRSRGEFQFASWADFAAGRPTTWQQRFGSTVRGFRTSILGAFVQDDWRITPSLTLNLGFRTEWFGPVSEVNHLTSNIDLDCRDAMGRAGTGPLGCVRQGLQGVAANLYPQPRVGFAWHIRPNTVIRGGYGLTADFNFLNPITNMRSLPPLVANANVSGLTAFTGGNTFANLYAGRSTAQAGGMAAVGALPDILNFGDFNPVVNPDLKNPQVHQWSFGIQQELPQAIVLKVNYVGTKGNFLPRTRQINLNGQRPAPTTSLSEEAARVAEFRTSYDSMTGTPTRRSTRMDPRFNIVNYYDNSANSNFHALEVMAGRSFREWYSFHAGYTWSKSIDDVSDALTTIPNDSTLIQNPLNTAENRSVSGFDTPHRVVFTHIMEFPWGARLTNGVAKRLLGGWGMSGISSWRKGFPVSFESGPRYGIINPSLITTGGVMRPDSSGAFEFNPAPQGSIEAPPIGFTNDPTTTRINAYAASLGLSQPLLGNFGNLGRNTHRLNNSANFDWNVHKNTAITERINVQLRLEVYNVFNNKTFQDVSKALTSPNFGHYTTTVVTQPQRYLQLGAVLRF
jgi:hypothetical protein